MLNVADDRRFPLAMLPRLDDGGGRLADYTQPVGLGRPA